jgi:hypothetical protein
VIVASISAFADAEDSYRLKVETIRYAGPTEQNLTQESVLNSLELIVWPSRPFQIESTHQGDSIRAEGQVSIEDGAFTLEIAYEKKRPSSQSKSETRIALKLDEIQEFGSITHATESNGKRHVTKDVNRAALTKVTTSKPTVRIQPIPPKARQGFLPQEAGMMIDAIEHKQRFQRLLRDQKNLPTTFETNRFDRSLPFFDPFSVPKRN